MHLQVYLYDNVFVGTIKDRSKRGQIFIFNRKGENSNSSFTRYENDLNSTVCKYIHVSVHKAQHIQLNEDLYVYICCLTCQNQLSIQFPRNCLHRVFWNQYTFIYTVCIPVFVLWKVFSPFGIMLYYYVSLCIVSRCLCTRKNQILNQMEECLSIGIDIAVLYTEHYVNAHGVWYFRNANE